MDLAVTEGELHVLLSEVVFTRQYGFRLHAIGDGECTLEVPFQELFERPGARLNGQVFMAAVAECRRLDGGLLSHHGITYVRAPARAVA